MSIDNQMEFEDKLSQLVFCADTYFRYSKAYKEKLGVLNKGKQNHSDSKRESIKGFLRLHVNTFLYASVLCLHSLLKENNDPEISFQKYYNKFGKDSKDIRPIIAKYKKYNLDQLRDKLIAHKEIKNIGDPYSAVVLEIKTEWIEKVQEIINDFINYQNENFNVAKNNYIFGHSKEGLDMVLECINRKMKMRV